MVGSPWCMGPQVGLKPQYHVSCNTYSFAILFWKLLSQSPTTQSFYMHEQSQEQDLAGMNAITWGN
jgi:dipeptide/tripeptide permease